MMPRVPFGRPAARREPGIKGVQIGARKKPPTERDKNGNAGKEKPL
jgi:hypothetical protein